MPQYLSYLFEKYFKPSIKSFLVVYAIVFALVYAVNEFNLFSLRDMLNRYGANNSIAKAWNEWQDAKRTSGIPRGDYLIIPILQVAAPLQFVASADPKDYVGPLKKGVAHFPSVLPGQKGVSIILGHSAPAGWVSQGYDAVFRDISKIKNGDALEVYYKRKRYAYKARGTIFLERGADIDPSQFDSNVPTLFLISCWPPGIDNKRIIVYGELVT